MKLITWVVLAVIATAALLIMGTAYFVGIISNGIAGLGGLFP